MAKKRIRQGLKKYFIPHAENDHRPHLLRPRAVIFVCAIALVIEGVYLFGSSYLIPRSRLYGTILVNALVDGTNKARLTQNLPPLKENALLDLAAQKKANDMVTNHYFAHTSPGGLTPWYWFKTVNYDFLSAGENLAVDFTDSADVTNAWLNSPGHRANIMQANYTEIGMAVAQGEYEGHPATFVVELFGTPVPTFNFAPIAAAAEPKSAPVSVPQVKSASPTPTPAPVAGAATTSDKAVASIVVPVSATVTAPVALPESRHAFQSNIIQSMASDPRRIVDYLYFGIVLLFATALFLNIFIKIRVQHPQAILGGMLVIVLAGLFIVLNQHVGAGVAIL